MPDFVLARSVRSRSDFFAASITYFSTASFCAAVVSSFTIGCSGAMTMYVAPKSVSGRVVYTVSFVLVGLPSLSAIGNCTSPPVLRPIQFFCMSFTLSGQSSSSRSLKRRSAYAVIFKIHWRIVLWVTVAPQRSHFPSFTSSLARPVLHDGHQLIGVSASYASPFL